MDLELRTMTIDEAIGDLSNAIVCVEMTDDPDLIEAIKLGIAALERIKNGGHLSLDELLKPLPGEAEDWERRPKRKG